VQECDLDQAHVALLDRGTDRVCCSATLPPAKGWPGGCR